MNAIANLGLGGGGLGDATRLQLKDELEERKKKAIQAAQVPDMQRQGYTGMGAAVRGLLGGSYLGAIGNGY